MDVSGKSNKTQLANWFCLSYEHACKSCNFLQRDLIAKAMSELEPIVRENQTLWSQETIDLLLSIGLCFVSTEISQAFGDRRDVSWTKRGRHPLPRRAEEVEARLVQDLLAFETLMRGMQEAGFAKTNRVRALSIPAINKLNKLRNIILDYRSELDIWSFGTEGVALVSFNKLSARHEKLKIALLVNRYRKRLVTAGIIHSATLPNWRQSLRTLERRRAKGREASHPDSGTGGELPVAGDPTDLPKGHNQNSPTCDILVQ